MYASIAVRVLPSLAISTTCLAILGLRGQFGSFLAQPAMWPMPQPHSQSRSFSACMAAVFCPSLIPSKLMPATADQLGRLHPTCGEFAFALVHLGRGRPRPPWRVPFALSRSPCPTCSRSATEPARGPISRPIRKPASRPTARVQGQMFEAPLFCGVCFADRIRLPWRRFIHGQRHPCQRPFGGTVGTLGGFRPPDEELRRSRLRLTHLRISGQTSGGDLDGTARWLPTSIRDCGNLRAVRDLPIRRSVAPENASKVKVLRGSVGFPPASYRHGVRFPPSGDSR